MSSEKAPATVPSGNQPQQQRDIYYRWDNESRTSATTTQRQSMDGRLVSLLVFVPLLLHQWVIHVMNCYILPLGTITFLGWRSILWFHTYPASLSNTIARVDIDDTDEDDDENDATNDDVTYPDKIHEKSHDPSDVVTVTEFDDDDDDDTTTTMDVDGDHDSHHDILRKRSILIQETTTPKKLYSMHDFQRHRILGSGQFGQVWLVSEKHPSASKARSSKECALKVISKYDLIVNDEVDMIIREKNIMNRLSQEPHPFIVQLQASFHNDNFLFLLQEFCPGGELFSLMHQKTNINKSQRVRLPLNQVAFYTQCIADALEYMHTQHCIVYRDLKPENVMLDERGYPKLIDMGYAKVLTNDDDYVAYTFCGTPNYIAPEMIQISSTMGCSFHVDHWALGILVHEMLFGAHPFNTNDDMDQMELFNTVCYDEYSVTAPDNNDNDIGMYTDAIDLTTQLLIKDPEHRLGRTTLGGDSICDQPFLTNTFDVRELRNKTIVAPWIPCCDPLVNCATWNGRSDTPGTTTDFFQQQYPKLSKREKTLFDVF